MLWPLALNSSDSSYFKSDDRDGVVLDFVRQWGLKLTLSLSFRLMCYATMLWMLLWAEARPAPTLPDVMLSHVPLIPWVERYNYLILFSLYLPTTLYLVLKTPEFASRYFVSSGLVALIRGVCIAATGLGPINGADIHAGLTDAQRIDSFLRLVNPLNAFQPDTGLQIALTKDLFFSGHTSMTFLLLLYAWRVKPLRVPALLCHVSVVASVIFGHLHYSIDIIGAYAVTFSIFSIREGWPIRQRVSTSVLGTRNS
jgi:membrane-associated phospholipid phosphatase